jgi:site-specific DNA-methyltransferase (adenine-specific)
VKPYYEESGIRIYHGDCQELLKELPVRCSAFVTDPPFAFTGGASHGMSSVPSDQFFAFWWRALCGQLTAVCKDDGSGFIWCDWRTASSFAGGFTPQKQTTDHWRMSQMLFHHREMPGMGTPFRSSVDMIAYVRGPKNKDGAIPNTTLNFISEYWYYGKHDHHPCEKSTSVAKRLIEWTGTEGVVLDPFMGSGTTLVAAKRLGRQAIGIEIEERHCETAARRLSQHVFDFTEEVSA